jgi:16S rRNA C967 or C1407 C5-methylase (RsmB/RsmF family)
MCAAPGGKTAHIAAKMGGKGTLVALERSASRSTKMAEALGLLGCGWVHVHKMDACKVLGNTSTTAGAAINGSGGRKKKTPKTKPKSGKGSDLATVNIATTDADQQDAPPVSGAHASVPASSPGKPGPAVQYPPGWFDRVLLDAPCTGLGQRPRTVNVITYDTFITTPRLQRKLFASAVQLVRAGGTLVYSTCTINPAENEEVV